LQNPEEEQLALLMTRDPVSITQEKDITDAARLIIEHNIRRLPVVEDGKLIGLLTVADIVGALADLNLTDHVGQYSSNKSVAVWSETPLNVVARIMELANVKAVPVLNSDLELIGIIADRDVISASIIEDSVEMSNMPKVLTKITGPGNPCATQ
jgi:CBS domain-containing protein